MEKQQSTAQMFEEFYGKPFSKITQVDLGNTEEIDWGEDVGCEVLNDPIICPKCKTAPKITIGYRWEEFKASSQLHE